MADEDIAEPDEEPEEPSSERSAWNWWLLVIPVLALVTAVIVLLYGTFTLQPTGIHESVELWHIVVVGSVVLVGLLIAEIVLMSGGHPDNLEDEEEPAPGPERTAAREDLPDREAEALEMLATDDEVEGHTVLEVARPPKGTVDAGVYATTYVEVDTGHVLRLEEIVAERT